MTPAWWQKDSNIDAPISIYACCVYLSRKAAGESVLSFTPECFRLVVLVRPFPACSTTHCCMNPSVWLSPTVEAQKLETQ